MFAEYYIISPARNARAARPYARGLRDATRQACHPRYSSPQASSNQPGLAMALMMLRRKYPSVRWRMREPTYALPLNEAPMSSPCIHFAPRKVTTGLAADPNQARYTWKKPLAPNCGAASLLSAAAFATGRKSARSRRHVSDRLTNSSSAASKDSASSAGSWSRRTST